MLIASNLRVGITCADIAFSVAMSLGFNLLLGITISPPATYCVASPRMSA